MGLMRTYPERRQDIQSHQNGKLLLSEKRALKLMGESMADKSKNMQTLCFFDSKCLRLQIMIGNDLELVWTENV